MKIQEVSGFIKLWCWVIKTTWFIKCPITDQADMIFKVEVFLVKTTKSPVTSHFEQFLVKALKFLAFILPWPCFQGIWGKRLFAKKKKKYNMIWAAANDYFGNRIMGRLLYFYNLSFNDNKRIESYIFFNIFIT